MVRCEGDKYLAYAVAAAAAPTRIPVRTIDVTLRQGGATTPGGAFEGTSLQCGIRHGFTASALRLVGWLRDDALVAEHRDYGRDRRP